MDEIIRDFDWELEDAQVQHWAFPCESHSPAQYPHIRSTSEPMGITTRELTTREREKLDDANELFYRIANENFFGIGRALTRELAAAQL